MLHRLGLLQKAVGPALTYDSIDGLPVEVGLYTALVPMVLYAVMGTSQPLSVSTTSTIAMLTATEPVTLYAYLVGMKNGNLGYASAIAYALLIMIIIFSTVFLNSLRRRGASSE